MNKTTTTRRSFLKSTLATGAAALVCGTKGQAKVLGANDRLRIAVAGLIMGSRSTRSPLWCIPAPAGGKTPGLGT